jgi:hypothetical protein
VVRWLVCGSRVLGEAAVWGEVLDARAVWERSRLWSVLDVESMVRRPDVVICGGARGADRLAARWARSRGVEVVEFVADWDRHGRRAGFVRNRRMLKEGNPDVVFAFTRGSLLLSKGTVMMVGLARGAGVETVVVEL